MKTRKTMVLLSPSSSFLANISFYFVPMLSDVVSCVLHIFLFDFEHDGISPLQSMSRKAVVKYFINLK